MHKMSLVYSSLCAPIVVESVLYEFYDLLHFVLWVHSPFICSTLNLPGGTPPRAKADASDSGVKLTSGEYPS